MAELLIPLHTAMSHRRTVTFPDQVVDTYSFADTSHTRATPATITSVAPRQEVTVDARYYNVINLPSTPFDGQEITVKCNGFSSAVQPITITGSAIDELGTTQQITAPGDAFTLTWSVDELGNVSNRWTIS